jgi:16S rRNA (cytosine1402-N4)-methyltransferase
MNETAPSRHVPVMVEAVVSALAPRDGAVYVDATFGGGGYSAALLARAACHVFGIDRDPTAVRRGRTLALRHGGRLTLI